MAERIKRRGDVSPERGEHQYGDVAFADPVNNKYPIDTPEHVRAAWSYINHTDNAAKYSKGDVRTIKGRATGRARSARGEPPLANLIPLIIDRQILVDGALAHCLDPVQPRIALVAGLEARRNVGSQRELKTL